MLVELAVHRRGVDRHIGMVAMEHLDAFRRREQADELDLLRARLFDTNGYGYKNQKRISSATFILLHMFS